MDEEYTNPGKPEWQTDLVLGSESIDPESGIFHGYMYFLRDPRAVREYICRGGPIDAHDDAGNTLLLYAIWTRQSETMRLLIEAGANVHAVNARGRGALHNMANRPNGGEDTSTDDLGLLISKGCDVNLGDTDGVTPALAEAINNRRIEHLLLLLDAGADLRKASKDGRMAISLLGAGEAIVIDAHIAAGNSARLKGRKRISSKLPDGRMGRMRV